MRRVFLHRERKWAALAAVAIVVVWIARGVLPGLDSRNRGDDPVLRGERASEWFRRMARPGAFSFPELDELPLTPATPAELRLRGDEAYWTLRLAGTNALPFLVRTCLESERSAGLRGLFERLRNRLPSIFGEPRQDLESMLAEDLMERIRPDGEILVALLDPWLSSTHQPLRARAGGLLARCGTNGHFAVPRLKTLLQTNNIFTQHSAGFALSRLGGEAAGALPELLALLRSGTRPSVQYSACVALGNCGPAAAEAIPRLEVLMREAPGEVAIAAGIALCLIQPRHAEAWPWLVSAANGTADDRDGRRVELYQVLGALGQFQQPHPDLAELALRMVTRERHRPDSVAGERALVLLHRFDPPVAERLVRSRLGRTSPPEDIVRTAADWLLQQPESGYAKEALLRFVAHPDPSIRVLAVRSLFRARSLSASDRAAMRAGCDGAAMDSRTVQELDFKWKRLELRDRFEREAGTSPNRSPSQP